MHNPVRKVIEELSDAFQSWFDLRQKDDMANPPGYRNHGDERPHSTVTFKADGFRHVPDNNRVRLSKGKNLKGNWPDFLLGEYETRPEMPCNRHCMKQITLRVHPEVKETLEGEASRDG